MILSIFSKSHEIANMDSHGPESVWFPLSAAIAHRKMKALKINPHAMV